MQDKSELVRSNAAPICDQFNDSNADSNASLGAANASYSRKYIFPGVIEVALRRCIEDAPKQGILPIRLAMLAAQLYGTNWFSVWDALKQLKGIGKDPHPRQCAERMQSLGLTETRKHKVGGRDIYQARLRADVMLFDVSHFHGKTAMRLTDGIETFYASRSNASGLAGLLLVGIHVTGLTNSTDLRKFCEPQHSYSYPSPLTSKILGNFIDEGMVATIRPQGLTHGAFDVVPVGYSS